VWWSTTSSGASERKIIHPEPVVAHFARGLAMYLHKTREHSTTTPQLVPKDARVFDTVELTPSSHTRGHVTRFMQFQSEVWHVLCAQQSPTIRSVLQSMQISMEAHPSSNTSTVVGDPHTEILGLGVCSDISLGSPIHQSEYSRWVGVHKGECLSV
jgi:hypothetical protein